MLQNSSKIFSNIFHFFQVNFHKSKMHFCRLYLLALLILGIAILIAESADQPDNEREKLPGKVKAKPKPGKYDGSGKKFAHPQIKIPADDDDDFVRKKWKPASDEEDEDWQRRWKLNRDFQKWKQAADWEGPKKPKPADDEGQKKPKDGEGQMKPKPLEGEGQNKTMDGQMKPADGEGQMKPMEGEGQNKTMDGQMKPADGELAKGNYNDDAKNNGSSTKNAASDSVADFWHSSILVWHFCLFLIVIFTIVTILLVFKLLFRNRKIRVEITKK